MSPGCQPCRLAKSSASQAVSDVGEVTPILFPLSCPGLTISPSARTMMAKSTGGAETIVTAFAGMPLAMKTRSVLPDRAMSTAPAEIACASGPPPAKSVRSSVMPCWANIPAPEPTSSNSKM
jgi:hypothetical protein